MKQCSRSVLTEQLLWYCEEDKSGRDNTCLSIYVGIHTGFLVGGGKKFVGHCHSVMHEYAAHVSKYTIQIFKFSGGGEFQGLPPLYETLVVIDMGHLFAKIHLM